MTHPVTWFTVRCRHLVLLCQHYWDIISELGYSFKIVGIYLHM